MKIKISNLRLRCIIGINEWERDHKQDIIINIEIDFDGSAAAESDHIDDTVNYKTITKRIIEHVEHSDYFLIERMIDQLANIVLEDPRAETVWVKVDKPGALRFTDSVSVETTKSCDEL